MKRWLRALSGVGLLPVVVMQFFSSSHHNPAVAPGHDLLASNAPPAAVATILKNSCYDCHSFETRWPWYSYIVPISWSVARDVDAARASLNFSDWPHDDPSRARKRWRHIADAVESGDMPLSNYTWMHREAHLNGRQRAALLKWASEQAGD